jgi:hypothetical protein
MKLGLFCGAVALCISLTAGSAVAHHSIAAEFDQNKPVKVHGVVTSVLWSNPHAWLYLDAKESDGTVTHWSFELNGLNVLYRQGWRKDALPAGTELVVDAFLSKTSPHVGNTRAVTLADGRQLFSGPAPTKDATAR